MPEVSGRILAAGRPMKTFSRAGIGHALPFDGNAVASYFGIDKIGGQNSATAGVPCARDAILARAGAPALGRTFRLP